MSRFNACPPGFARLRLVVVECVEDGRKVVWPPSLMRMMGESVNWIKF